MRALGPPDRPNHPLFWAPHTCSGVPLRHTDTRMPGFRLFCYKRTKTGIEFVVLSLLELPPGFRKSRRVRDPGSSAAGCLSRSCSPPGLARGRQNRQSGREGASPCQDQLTFSCIQMRNVGKNLLASQGNPPPWKEKLSLSSSLEKMITSILPGALTFPLLHFPPPGCIWIPAVLLRCLS